jgi:hypothetical protein
MRKAAILGFGVLLLVIALLLVTVALAQETEQTTSAWPFDFAQDELSASYDLSWWTLDGGGGSSSGVNYVLDGTAGQPDPGPVLSGGNYNLEGGFWGGGLSGTTVFNIYVPLVFRNL